MLDGGRWASKEESLDAGTIVDPYIIQGDRKLLEGRRDRSEEDDKKVVDFPEGDLSPDPSVRSGGVPQDVDLSGAAAVGPGKHLEGGASSI